MDVRSLVKRCLTVVLAATISVALLTALLAWVALNASWALPDPAALNSPSVVYDRNGTEIARFTSEQDRREVRLEEVSDHGWQAVVAAEDHRFFEHTGVDLTALVRAVVTNLRTGDIRQGGSTLTQQYVRNGLEGVGRERTVVRKVKEAVLSVQLERDLGKQEILERYLNTVYFGEGAYGIEAAALTFFGVSASELTLTQAAALAQALPAPSSRNPRVDPQGAADRLRNVLNDMVLAGFVTPGEADAANDVPLEVQPRQRPVVTHPYFVEYVRKQLVHNFGQEAVLTGGLRVTTTIDPEAQLALEEAVAEHLPPQEGVNADVQAGAVAIDPRTGQILAMYGGRDFEESQLNLATQASRQNGSTFKPITYVAALRDGREPNDRYRAPSSITIPASQCRDYDSEAETSGSAPGGTMTMREGMIRSINTVLLQMACDVGPPAIVETAHDLGVRSPLVHEANPVPNPALALGAPAGPGASVLDMTSAFATIANDGAYCPATSLLRVRRGTGSVIDLEEVTDNPDYPARSRAVPAEDLEERPDELVARDTGRCRQMVHWDIARVTTEALEEVVRRTTGRRAAIGRPQAGKTGTTNEEVDAWFVGYTPDLAIAVWVGHRDCSDPTNPDCRLRNIEGFHSVQGGTIPALIWKAAAERMLADVPPNTFLEPGELSERGRRRPGPPMSQPDPSPSSEPSPEPSPDGSPSPEPSPSPDGGTDGGGDTGDGSGGDDGGDDGGNCIPVIQDCD